MLACGAIKVLTAVGLLSFVVGLLVRIYDCNQLPDLTAVRGVKTEADVASGRLRLQVARSGSSTLPIGPANPAMVSTAASPPPASGSYCRKFPPTRYPGYPARARLPRRRST